jgi:hypothetical protein
MRKQELETLPSAIDIKAGVVKLDLTEFFNNGIQEEEILTVSKSPLLCPFSSHIGLQP